MNTEQKKQIAKDAFYGVNEALMSIVMNKNGYEMDGNTLPANSISLSECIATVEAMSENEIAQLEALGIL